ncbi:MAG: hypothetical protein IJG68_00215 [Bacilli bacterium]|nr:hypothetical protein [Bacilli bacterium]
MNNNGDLEEFTTSTSDNSSKEKTVQSTSGIRPISNAREGFNESPKESIVLEGGEPPVEPLELSNRDIVDPGVVKTNKKAKPVERQITDVDEDGVDDVQELMDKMKLFSSEDYDSSQNVDVSNIKKRVRRREKKKILEFRLFNRFAIALIVFGTIVLILTIIYIIYINLPTKNGSTLPMGKIIQVKNSVNHYSLVVTEAETNVNVSRIGIRNNYNNNLSNNINTNDNYNNTTNDNNNYNSNTNDNYNNTTNNNNSNYNNSNYNNNNNYNTYVSSSEQFTRVKIQIKNNKGSPSPIRGVNDFYLVDSSHKVLATCYTEDDLRDYNINDALPSSLPQVGIVEGYVYCKTSMNSLPYLEIISASGITESTSPTENTKRSGESYYYVNLGTNRRTK